MDRNVLVTGGAGYIGATLVPKLLARNWRVTVLDNFTYGVEPMLHLAGDPRLRILLGDVREEALVRDEVDRHDTVIHLAAMVGHPACARDPLAATTINLGGTENVCRAAGPGKQLLYASTGSVYGRVEGLCTEATPLAPLTLYGESKADGERVMCDAGAVSLRLATAFGVSPRMRMDLLVHDLTHVAVTRGVLSLYEPGARRTFLHVRDMADAFLLALDNHAALAGSAINVGDEALNVTKGELARIIQKFTPLRIIESESSSDADARDYAVSYSRFKALGFRYRIGMEAGVEEILKIVRILESSSHWRNA